MKTLQRTPEYDRGPETLAHKRLAEIGDGIHEIAAVLYANGVSLIDEPAIPVSEEVRTYAAQQVEAPQPPVVDNFAESALAETLNVFDVMDSMESQNPLLHLGDDNV